MPKCDYCGKPFSKGEPRVIKAFEEAILHTECFLSWKIRREKWEHCKIECKGRNNFTKCLKQEVCKN